MSKTHSKKRSRTQAEKNRHVAISSARRGWSPKLVIGLAAGILVIVAAAVWYWSSQRPNFRVPEVSTSGLEPAVVQLIQQHTGTVRRSPESSSAWGNLGAVLKSLGFRGEAGYCLAQAERLDPREPRWPYFQTTLEPDAPLAFFEAKLRRAVELCGNEPEMPRLRLARLLVESGRAAEAEAELSQLLQAKPKCAPARLLMARLSQARGDATNAIDLASGTTASPYTARAAWNFLSTLQLRRGDTNAAAVASRRANAAAPDASWPDPFEDEILVWRTDARSLSDRAQNYIMAGRTSEALPIVQRMSRDYPSFPESWLLLGRTLNVMNQSAAAEQALRRLLQLEPTSVNGQFQLGTSLMQQKRFAEAAETFRYTTTLKRDFAPAFFNLGFSLVKSGKLREAVPAFEEAILHSPEKVDTYILLSDLYLQLGEKEKAAQLAQLAQQLDPTDPRLPALRRKLL